MVLQVEKWYYQLCHVLHVFIVYTHNVACTLYNVRGEVRHAMHPRATKYDPLGFRGRGLQQAESDEAGCLQCAGRSCWSLIEIQPPPRGKSLPRSTRGSSRGEIQPHSRHGSELASADRYGSVAIVRNVRPGCSGEGRISLQYEPDKKF